MRSIRVFLVAVILAAITLFDFVAALRGYQSSMVEADRLFDKQLLETTRLITSLFSEGTGYRVDLDSYIAFQVWQRTELRASSDNTPTTPITEFKPGFEYANFHGYRWRTFASYDAERDLWILAAERMDQRFTLAENVILESIFPVLLGLPVAGLLIWIIVGTGLKPLRELADELRNRRPSDLKPLSVQAPKKELEQIVSSTNDLLDRLEAALLRERQFASDAAHELRTPISALKIQLYNIAQELPQANADIDELNSTVERLENIVEQILVLYRSSPDRYNVNFVKLDFSELIEGVLADEYSNFDGKNQQLSFEGAHCMLEGDRFALTTLLHNLLTNANKYTPPGGQIRVIAEAAGDEIRLTVEDSGPGIPPDQYRSVFERFYRVDRGRNNQKQPGCGLGLAIAKRIIDIHGGSISVSPSSFTSGVAFHVNLPKTQPVNSDMTNTGVRG